MIFAFIAECCSDLPVAASCRAMKVTTSGFYEYQHRQWAPSLRTMADAELTETIVEIHRQSRGTYGSPRCMPSSAWVLGSGSAASGSNG